MGPDWKDVWMGIREYVQNSVDEGEMNVVPNIENIEGKEGKTRCYIEINNEIQDVIDNWDTYFTFDRIDELFQSGDTFIYPNKEINNNLILFSKGIKCTDFTRRPSLFHYSGNIEMNESRIIKHEWQGKEIAANILAICINKNVIHSVLTLSAKENMFEKDIWDDYLSIRNLNLIWKEVIGDKKIIVSELAGWFEEEQRKYDHFIVSEKLCKRIRKSFSDVVIYGLTDDGQRTVNKKQVELDKRKQFLLLECQRFFDECNYKIEYSIEVVRFDDSDKLGLAENNTIFISEKCFDMGKREIISTLIEENEHLKTGYKDCSRAFQQHFINLFILEKEERFGFFN